MRFSPQLIAPTSYCRIISSDHRLLRDDGSNGLKCVVDKFLENHPEIPRTQVVSTIKEVAVKEQREGDKLKVQAIV